jgi:hypothetical protein
MKVLEKGREQQGWSAELTCTGANNGGGGCGAKLLVEQGDLFLSHSEADDMQDDEDAWITFACMACGVWTDLEDIYDALKAILPNGPGRDGETVDLSELPIPNGIISPQSHYPYYYCPIPGVDTK